MIASVRDLYDYSVSLYNENNIDNAAFEVNQILAVCMQVKTLDPFIMEHAVTKKVIDDVTVCVKQRLQGIPLQYIIGEWDFYGHTFFVEQDVLIPRPETEELTDRALSFIKSKKYSVIYDVCGGTGCIGITIAKECPWTHVYIFELYKAPLHCIRRNIQKFSLTNVTLIPLDVLTENIPDDLPLADVIISNPPYIPSAQIADLQTEVRFEPSTALDGGVDGLMFYHKLASVWYAVLKNGGRMFLECAEDQTTAIVNMFPSTAVQAPDCGAFCDFYGLPRFVILGK